MALPGIKHGSFVLSHLWSVARQLGAQPAKGEAFSRPTATGVNDGGKLSRTNHPSQHVHRPQPTVGFSGEEQGGLTDCNVSTPQPSSPFVLTSHPSRHFGLCGLEPLFLHLAAGDKSTVVQNCIISIAYASFFLVRFFCLVNFVIGRVTCVAKSPCYPNVFFQPWEKRFAAVRGGS